jgi:hypothetical protein
MPRFSLKSLLIGITLIGLAIGLLRGCYLHLTHFETAENVERVDWLPNTASNISYYRSYNFTAYEFDISEDEFRRWTWLKVKPISEPVEIYRYSFVARSYQGLGPNPTNAQLEAAEAVERATISDGLYYEERHGNGRGVSIAYDRKRGRAFFQANPR